MKSYYISNNLIKLLFQRNIFGGEELFSQPTFDIDICEDSLQNKVDNYIFNSKNINLEEKIKFIFIDRLNKLINVEIKMNDKTIHLNAKKISQGSYGIVYKLHNLHFGIEFALKLEKIETSPEPLEKDIGEDLTKYNCNTIRVKYIKSDDKFNYYIMDLVDGDLTDLFSKWEKNIKSSDEYKKKVLSITEEIRKQILCLYMMKKQLEDKYAYLDLKFENVLYNCDDDKVKIHLGDLGSAVLQDEETWVSTFPPPETIPKNEDDEEMQHGIIYIDMFDNTEIEKMLSWQIGTILLRFMCEYEKSNLPILEKYYFSNISVTEQQKISVSVIDLLNKFYNSEKIGYYLSIDIEKRPSITESILSMKKQDFTDIDMDMDMDTENKSENKKKLSYIVDNIKNLQLKK